MKKRQAHTKWPFGLLFFVFCLSTWASAQKATWVDTVSFSENTIIPSSLLILSGNDTLGYSEYSLLLGTGKIAFRERYDSSYSVSFRTLSWNLSEKNSNLSQDLIQEKIQSNDPFQGRNLAPVENSINEPFSGLTRSGSISRSLSIGNNQDAVLQSQLNLQLSGEIGKNTFLRASISDQNLPVQPEGTTQSLREFDRVFIELENPDFGKILAGDFVLNNRKSNYLSFDKKLSGALIEAPFAMVNGDTLTVKGVGALARGQFARNTFRGQEGNQGPYRLRGNQSELYIIILSGSERVYIDGVLMTRGQDRDYIIDYNTGELTFTPLRPITKDRRIVVEFQYTEQNFVRTFGYAEVDYKTKSTKNNIQFYSEQDNKNQPLAGELSDFEKRILSNAGDDPLNAVAPGWSPANYEPGRLLYEIVDSLGFDTVFVLAPPTSSAQLFNVQFAFVGANKGDYVIDPANANGRVFKWTPPIAGVPQGNYVPLKILPRPSLKQIIALEGEANLNENNKIFYHGGFSRNDPNTFSEIDNENHTGLAGKLGYQYGNSQKGWYSGITLEHVDSSFSTVERFREVEFSRNWNLPFQAAGRQQAMEGRVGYIKEANQRGEYSFQWLNLGDQFSGTKHNLLTLWNNQQWKINFSGSYLQSQYNLEKTQFARQKSSLTRYLPYNLYVGFQSEAERNSRSTDTVRLTQRSYQFLEGHGFVGFGDSTKAWVEISAGLRNDDTARSSDYAQQAFARFYRLKSKIRNPLYGNWEFTGQYRELENYYNSDRSQQTTTGRINFNHQFWKRSIQVNTLYQVGVGAEPIREYRYIPVPAGTGTHTWRDYNNNGIQELDEFEIAQFPDEATFLRTYILGNELLSTSDIQFSQLIRWSPKRLTSNRLLGLFSFQGQYSKTEKSLFTSSQNDLNPFREIRDSALVTTAENIRGSVFINRGSPNWGGEYTYLKNTQINNQSYGIESGDNVEHQLRSRYQFLSSWEIRLDYTLGQKTNQAVLLPNRDYVINSQRFNPQLVYQPGPEIKITLQSTLKNSDERVTSHSLKAQSGGILFNWNRGGKWNLQAGTDLVNNQFQGNANSPSGYALLEGLQPGINYVWQSQVQVLLSSFLQLNIQYQGRKTETSNVVHTGTMQIKAFF